ncbi:MAG: hypothetical protein ABSC95_26885, partial [Acetobacteraceae bacterium]
TLRRALRAHHAGRLGATAGPFREVLAVNAGFAQALDGMGAAEHDPHGELRFVGVAGAQGFEAPQSTIRTASCAS